jgi:glycosyltransferase involved in cell wall biosynthesis
MFICWLGPPATATGGVGNLSRHTAAILATRGHDVDYRDTHEVSPAMQAARQAVARPDSPEGQAQLAAVIRASVTAFVQTLEAAWQARRPDILFVEVAGNHARAAVDLARRIGLPVVSGWHNLHRYAPPGQARRMRDLALQFHRVCQATIVQCREDGDALRAAGIPGVVQVAPGVDLDVFAPRHRDPALRAAWGAEAGDPVLLWYSRVVVQKSPWCFAAIAGAVRAVVPRVRAVVVGDGPELAHLRLALPWATCVGRLTGVELSRHVASADLMVFPSTSEGFGNVVPESLASGLAVAAYARASGAACISDGVEGILLPPGEIAGLAEGCVRLAADLPRLRAMGEAARRRAEGMGWDAVASALEPVLVQAAATGRPA